MNMNLLTLIFYITSIIILIIVVITILFREYANFSTYGKLCSKNEEKEFLELLKTFEKIKNANYISTADTSSPNYYNFFSKVYGGGFISKYYFSNCLDKNKNRTIPRFSKLSKELNKIYNENSKR